MKLRHTLPLLLLVTLPAYGMGDDQAEHVRSSFLFADRKEWNDAQLHAQRSDSAALATLITWEYLLDMNSGASFEEIRRFTVAHPDWPEQKKLRIRGEMALDTSTASNDEIIEWFSSAAPITGVGKVALAKALTASGKQPPEMISSLIREAWRGGDFDETQEQSLLATYGPVITKADDISRLDRLLWDAKTGQVERMYDRVDAGYQKLAKARIALQAGKKNAPQLVSQVPSALRHDLGLLYDRVKFRAAHDDDAGVREILLATPKTLPYPEKWWKIREQQVREAIDDGEYKLAAKLLANHAQIEGQPLADANWLNGWLLLEYQNRPKDAYQAFYKMFDSVRYPVSKSRAAYWAARAAAKAGDKDGAQSWYNTATAYPTTFYGQLASYKFFGTAPLHIPAPMTIPDEARTAFEARDLVQAVQVCLQFDQPDTAGKLINYLVETAGTKTEAALAGELGAKAGKIYLSVRGAKKALQDNVVLIDAGYPQPKTPDGLSLERAFTLAIARQESEFDKRAESPSGALGLMQLLPATAREIAHKNDLGFEPDRLYEPDYNMTLGSLYLQHLVDNYDGSYVMAIAAYNAGPGNVHKWAQKFGTPGNNLDNAVDWIEKIPFTETRNYVQRVLENMQVYRHIEADGDEAAKLKLGDDLVR